MSAYKIEVEIVALTNSISGSHSYAVVIGELDGVRRIPIIIGHSEAQAIAVAMERMTPSRPLTHDLMRNAFETFEIDLKEIIINDLQDGIFYARLICLNNGKSIEIDSRTSDALAMAVRFDCPIYTYEFIMDAAGVILEEGEEEASETLPSRKTEKRGNTSLKSYSLEDLEEMLEEVIGREDYEKAARIRDEINRR